MRDQQREAGSQTAHLPALLTHPIHEGTLCRQQSTQHLTSNMARTSASAMSGCRLVMTSWTLLGALSPPALTWLSSVGGGKPAFFACCSSSQARFCGHRVTLFCGIAAALSNGDHLQFRRLFITYVELEGAAGPTFSASEGLTPMVWFINMAPLSVMAFGTMSSVSNSMYATPLDLTLPLSLRASGLGPGRQPTHQRWRGTRLKRMAIAWPAPPVAHRMMRMSVTVPTWLKNGKRSCSLARSGRL